MMQEVMQEMRQQMKQESIGIIDNIVKWGTINDEPTEVILQKLRDQIPDEQQLKYYFSIYLQILLPIFEVTQKGIIYQLSGVS